MDAPVNYEVSYPSPVFAVAVHSPAAFPVILPGPPAPEILQSQNSLSIQFPNIGPAAITVIHVGADGSDGADGADGQPGENANIVVLTLAAYLALDAPTQMNGTWYVIPK